MTGVCWNEAQYAKDKARTPMGIKPRIFITVTKFCAPTWRLRTELDLFVTPLAQ
jgi:hypothetical protein